MHDTDLFRQRTEPSSVGEKAWVHLVPLEDGDFAALPQGLPPRIEASSPIRQVSAIADAGIARLSRIAWQKEARGADLRSGFLRLFWERHNPSGGWTPYVEEGEAREAPDPEKDRLYLQALESGLGNLGSGGFCRKLPCLVHAVLLPNGAGRGRSGRYREIQTWWQAEGQSRRESPYLGPPAPSIPALLDSLERFLAAPPAYPPSWIAALFYLQFVAIQPFEDGNRRTAGILANLFWVKNRILPHPLLDLSGYFRWTGLEWIYRFLRVIRYGEWEEWIRYYLEGLILECHRGALMLEGRMGEGASADESLYQAQPPGPSGPVNTP